MRDDLETRVAGINAAIAIVERQINQEDAAYSSFQVISALWLSYREENYQPSKMPVAYSTDLRTRVIDA
jgi:ribonuclease PH